MFTLLSEDGRRISKNPYSRITLDDCLRWERTFQALAFPPASD